MHYENIMLGCAPLRASEGRVGWVMGKNGPVTMLIQIRFYGPNSYCLFTKLRLLHILSFHGPRRLYHLAP